MSIARITTINYKSKEAADKSREDYSSNAPNEFPEAEQLIQVHVDDTTVMAISLYADKEAMERATAELTDPLSGENLGTGWALTSVPCTTRLRTYTRGSRVRSVART